MAIQADDTLSIVDIPSGDRSGRRTFSISLFHCSIIGLLCIGAIIRLWNIASVPIELHPDEMATYLGVRDMLTGRKPLGVFLDYGVTYLPLYGFFANLSVLLFGNNPTAIRLPAALLGVATSYATGLLAYQFVRSRLVLLAACGLMAILPWDIAISRIGAEPAATLPFLLFGLYFVRRGLYESRARDFYLGFGLLAVGGYSFRAELFDAFVLAFALLAIEFPRAWAARRDVIGGTALGIVILLPLIITCALNPGYFNDGPLYPTFTGGVNAYTLSQFISLYFMHFSVGALFINGDGNLDHGPAVGVLYLWTLPFILIALLAPWRPFTLRARLFLLAWTAIYPIGGAITDEGRAHFIRTLVGAPLFCILAAIGITAVWQFTGAQSLRRFLRPLLAIVGIVAAFEFVIFCNAYFIVYPDQSAPIFHYGDRDIFAFVRAHQAGFNRVCFTVLDGWNYTAEVGYYMGDDAIETINGLGDPTCKLPGTLLALDKPEEAPSDARYIGSVQHRDGTIRSYFFAL